MLISIRLFSQSSPHGDQLTVSCEDCHNPTGWKMIKGTYAFSHDSTSFALQGQHQVIDCKMCHTSLVFNEADNECMSCHTDMHYQTVGFDCERCHTPQSWIVDNIIDVHRLSRFPLLGPHATADCQQCHPSASLLRFEPLGVECIDCHQDDYYAATNPNHVEGGFSTDCVSCHNMNVFSWTGSNFNHSFFPLTEGHSINDCKQCHTSPDYSQISSDCISCHEVDYNSTTNPNHLAADISINCSECHTTLPGWKPAEFKQHDGQYFPIYSGKHNNEWVSCTDCHTDPTNYIQFTCIDCHEHNQSDMDEEHQGIGGYIFNSVACLDCHPTGDAEDGFDHNQSNFPLTGAHTTVDCASCHTEGYSGTSTVCYDCHTQDFNQSLNPSHTELGVEMDCENCHTTAPDWTPATFENHNDYYFLSGAHATIGNECFSCHQGDYNNTPTNCAGCHTNEFDLTTNPNHTEIGLSNVCDICHTTNPEWKPAQFPDHNEYYLLVGAHAAIATDCNICHNGDYNSTPNTCVGCHLEEYNQTSDPPHEPAGFSTVCEECHSETAWIPSTFDHDGQYFPIYSGKHNNEWDNCVDCHTNQNNYAVFSCIDCHEHNKPDTDEEHQGVNGYEYNSEACYACHPTGDGDDGINHDLTNFPLTGAHLTIDCLSCHEDGYTGTTTICFDCHTSHYNESSNPDHLAISIPNVCEDCHSTVPNWTPALFPIHNDYYELTGAHIPVANDCASCHDGNYNNTPNTCSECHISDFNESSDPNHIDLDFPIVCEDCHTTSQDWSPALFLIHDNYYELTGAHTAINDCALCHENGYSNTPDECFECHTNDFNETSNPNHTALNLSTICEDCHTTIPGWEPALFPVHNDYYALNGAHTSIADDCTSCHDGDYNNTPNTCYGCHQNDYNQTNDPPHQSAQFPTDCELCHTEIAWIPSTFNHDAQYFPIYSGSHNEEWNMCADCHTNPSNYAIFSCLGCHEQNETDDDHSEVVDYLYESTACLDCHPNGNSDKRMIIRKIPD